MSNTLIALRESPSTAQLLRRIVLARKPSKPRWPERLEATLRVDALDPRWLAAYRDVCGFGGDTTVPATIPQVRAVPMHIAMLVDPAFPFPPMGVVHVRQRLEVLQPIDASAPLQLTSHLSRPRQAKRGTEFDLVTEASDTRGVVWRGVTSVLSRKKIEGAESNHDDANSGSFGAVETPSPLRSAVWSLREDLGRRYTRVAGDFNPIHLYRWSAKLFGFDRAIIHGMWLLGRSLAELEDELPTAPYAVEIQFRKPVMLPGTVVFSSQRTGTAITFSLCGRDGRKEHARGSVEPVGA